MKHWKKWALALLVGAVLLGSSVTVLGAVQGSADNPLVTLGYLKDIFTKSILAESEKKITESQAAFEKKLSDKIDSLGHGGGSARFAVVDLAEGQSLEADIGCELVLRVGTAICQSPASPGLIDTTSGGTLEGGVALAKNHLYLSTIEGRSVMAQGGAVKILVKGGYRLS